jgi:hypothetical protein
MLAEVARRRSSWLRSLATARRLSRPLQVQATARPQEDEDEEGATATRPRDVEGLARSNPTSLSFLLQQQAPVGALTGNSAAPTPTNSANWPVAKLREQEESVELPADASAGEFPLLVDSGSPDPKDVERARASLRKLARDLADPSKAAPRETGFQRARRQLKAATGKLDRMLYAMRQRRDFAQVEAVAFVWEDELPHFAGQRKHWGVICEHYALALNYQQRFQDVVDKFAGCFREQEPPKGNARGVSLLSPRLAQSIFVALGHLRDASGALQLLDTMQRHGVHVTKVSYFHALNAMLHDDTFCDFESVMQICEEMVTRLPGEIVPLSLLPMVMMIAASCGESERAMKLYSHPPDMPMSLFTEFRFEICLQQLNQLGEDAMLMEMYRNLMASTTASRDLKERVSKYLFRQRVAITRTTNETRNERLGVACEILEIMNERKIRASHHAIYPLIRALCLDPLSIDESAGHQSDKPFPARVVGAKDLDAFFARYSNSLEWNEFALCEAIVAGVRAHNADLVDDLFVHALDRGMPIKYAALEQVVVYYYRLGLINDLERVSDLVHALRLNKHIPLGIAVTEVGMGANLRLGHYEEVIMLFEDFSSLDGERRRVLERQFMLKTALDAYTHLGRVDEAMAIKTLLNQFDGSLLDRVEGDETGGGDALDGEDEGSDASNSHEIGEKERSSLNRFTR